MSGLFKKEIARTRDEISWLDRRARLISLPADGDLSTIVFVGNSSNGDFFAKQLGPHLNRLGPAHFIAYPQLGFSTNAISDAYVEAVEKSDGMRKAVVFFSMGQLVFNYLMSRPEIAEGVGDIDYAIGDSGVTKSDDLQQRTQVLLKIGTFMPPSSLAAKIYGCFKQYVAAGKQLDMVAELSQEMQREFYMSTALTSLYTEFGQWKFIRHTEVLEPGSLASVAGRIAVKRFISAEQDKTVDPYRSFAHLQELYDDGSGDGGGWVHIIGDRRPRVSHAAGIMYPSEILSILNDQPKVA